MRYLPDRPQLVPPRGSRELISGDQVRYAGFQTGKRQGDGCFRGKLATTGLVYGEAIST